MFLVAAALSFSPAAHLLSRPRDPPRSSAASISMSVQELTLMVNGLPGAMGREIAAACLRRGLKLAPFALTGPGVPDSEIVIDDGRGGEPMSVTLFTPDQRR